MHEVLLRHFERWGGIDSWSSVEIAVDGGSDPGYSYWEERYRLAVEKRRRRRWRRGERRKKQQLQSNAKINV